MAGQDTFHLPEGLRYGCIQCGQSCKMFHGVTVEERSQRRVEEIDFRSLMPESIRNESFLVPSPTIAEKMILRRHEGTCVFQCADGLCGIHKKHGFAQKPQTCQDFPFRYVETPGGIYVGLSHACTAVLQNVGPAMEEQRASIEEAHPRANSVTNLRDTVRLTHRHEITWDAYLALEGDLRTILHAPGQPLGARLVAQAAYLDLYVMFLREVRSDSIHNRERALPKDLGTTGRFSPDSGKVPDLQVLAALRHKYLEDEHIEDLFRLASRMKGSAALQRAFIGLITAFRQSLDTDGARPTRVGTMLKILRHYLSHALKVGRVNLNALGKEFDYTAFARVRIDMDHGPDGADLLLRFLDHSLFRKDLLTVESVWLGQRLSLMHFALVRWHAVGKAALLGRDAVDEECLREAIRALELHYLTHTKIVTLFDRIPSLGMILDAIVRKPTYAPSMVGPVV